MNRSSFSVRSPSAPDFLVVKESHAPPVCTAKGLAKGCASWYIGRISFQYPQQSIRLWTVSTPPIPNDAPDPNGYDAAALKIIGKRPPFYSEPRLQSGHGERTVKGSKNADGEFRRRKRERGLYEELSRFYLLPETRATWTRPQLLVKGKHEHDSTRR